MLYENHFPDEELRQLTEEWIKIGLSTEALDHEKIKLALREAYTQSDFSAPEVIFVDSPKQGAVMSELFVDQDAVDAWYQIYGKVESQVRRLSNKLERDRVWQRVRTRVRLKVGRQVWNKVCCLVLDQLQLTSRDNIDFVRTPFYGQHLADDISLFAAFEAAPEVGKLLPFVELAKSAGWIWLFEKTAIVCARPSNIVWKGGECILVEYPDGWTATDLSPLEQLALAAD